MPPDGVGLFDIRKPVWLSPADVTGAVVVQHLIIIEKDHRVAGVCTRERLTDNDIPWLGRLKVNLSKSVGHHIFQVEILTTQPPTVFALEIRKVYSAKVIRVPEKRVAIHFPVLKPAPGKMRYRPEFVKHPITCQPPFNAGDNLHGSVSCRKIGVARRV